MLCDRTNSTRDISLGLSYHFFIFISDVNEEIQNWSVKVIINDRTKYLLGCFVVITQLRTYIWN